MYRQSTSLTRSPRPSHSLCARPFANQDVTCSKGTDELIATDWTQNFDDLADKLLEKFVFPALRGDDKDVYDCGAPGIKKAFVKGIAGCINKKKLFHGETCIDYVCNQQARTRKICVDGLMQLRGDC